MALRDIFRFRELPESETSKPFLEHLEDMRWTIVKIAITLVAAMVICFAFRSQLVRVMQAPMHEVDPQVGALRALGRVVPIAWVVDARLVSPRLEGWREDVLGNVDYADVRSRASSRRP